MATKNAKENLLDRLAKSNHVISTIDQRVVDTAKDMGIDVKPTHLNGEERVRYVVGHQD